MRHVLCAAQLWVALLWVVLPCAIAQTWPTKPIPIVVGTGAAGAPDILARQGAAALPMARAEFATFVERERSRYGELVKRAKVRLED